MHDVFVLMCRSAKKRRVEIGMGVGYAQPTVEQLGNQASTPCVLGQGKAVRHSRSRKMVAAGDKQDQLTKSSSPPKGLFCVAG